MKKLSRNEILIFKSRIVEIRGRAERDELDADKVNELVINLTKFIEEGLDEALRNTR